MIALLAFALAAATLATNAQPLPPMPGGSMLSNHLPGQMQAVQQQQQLLQQQQAAALFTAPPFQQLGSMMRQAPTQQPQQQVFQQAYRPTNAQTVPLSGIVGVLPPVQVQLQQVPVTPTGGSAAAAPSMCDRVAAAQGDMRALVTCPAAPVSLGLSGLGASDADSAPPTEERAAISWSAARGWSMRLVNARTDAVLEDPLDTLALVQEDVHTHPAAAWLEGQEHGAHWVEVDVSDEGAEEAGFRTAGIDEHAESIRADQIFDAEHSEFEAAGSGWSDPAILVHSNMGPCRGQLQPGRRIFCATPGSHVVITVLAKNTGTMPWIPVAAPTQQQQGGPLGAADASGDTGSVAIQMHLLDALQWSNPLATPMQLDQALQTGQLSSTSTGNARDVRGTLHALRLLGTTKSAGACVEPGDTGVFEVQLTAPSGESTPLPLGLHGLRLTPVGPCGPMGRTMRVNVEVSCSDGVFCNGVERWVNGQCEAPSQSLSAACDDGDACTVDVCEEEHGKCTQKMLNTTECRMHICGGDRCEPKCAAGQQCGANGCGGTCGLCQTGESCAADTGTCVADAQVPGTCFTPYELPVFSSEQQQHQWEQSPERFSKPSISADPGAFGLPASALPSELSRHVLRIPNVQRGVDSLNPSCVSFGSNPDFIYRFIVPENKLVTARSMRSGASATDALPLMMNADPLAQAVVRKDGYVAVDIQAYGKYSPQVDTVLEVRGTPGLFSSKASQGNLEKEGNVDPIYACMQDRSIANETMVTSASGATYPFLLRTTPLERSRRWALGLPLEGTPAAGANPHPLNPFVMCNDNAQPPGGVGSRLTVLLPPGTYYLAVSTFPRFNIPAHVQALQDASLGPAAEGMTESQAHEVEAVVRFVSGYLPDCDNVECGSDGAGNECGAGCGAEEVCSDVTRKCMPAQCVPQCADRPCGSDGCGGLCGQCSLASLSPETLASTPNALGVPFRNEDVYCIEESDPALEPLRRLGDGKRGKAPPGKSACRLMPEQCNGARPVCHGMAGANGEAQAGCPEGTFCANNCACLPLDTPLPDLLVKLDALMTQLSVSQYAFSPRSCSLVEKCISRPGVRKLLRFSVAIINQGAADLALPQPKTKPDDFVYSPCHHHYHYHHFADYSLIQGDKVMLRGHKQAFCLEDSMQESVGKDIPCLAHHTCTQPGIQKGWSDYYGADLDCQWIDVTDVDPGEYQLRIEVNSGRSLLESTFDNNVVALQINIP